MLKVYTEEDDKTQLLQQPTTEDFNKKLKEELNIEFNTALLLPETENEDYKDWKKRNKHIITLATKLYKEIIPLVNDYRRQQIEVLIQTSKNNGYKVIKKDYSERILTWPLFIANYIENNIKKKKIKTELEGLQDNTIYICKLKLTGSNASHQMCAVKINNQLFAINMYGDYGSCLPDDGYNITYTDFATNTDNSKYNYPCCVSTNYFIAFINEKKIKNPDDFKTAVEKAFENTKDSWYNSKPHLSTVQAIDKEITKIHQKIIELETTKPNDKDKKIEDLKEERKKLFTSQLEKEAKERTRSETTVNNSPRSSGSITPDHQKNNIVSQPNYMSGTELLLDNKPTKPWLQRLQEFFCCGETTVQINS